MGRIYDRRPGRACAPKFLLEEVGEDMTRRSAAYVNCLFALGTGRVLSRLQTVQRCLSGDHVPTRHSPRNAARAMLFGLREGSSGRVSTGTVRVFLVSPDAPRQVQLARVPDGERLRGRLRIQP